LGFSFALSTYLGALQDGGHISWKRIISGYLADFYLWGLFSPLIFKLARRFELRTHVPRNLLIHITASVVLSVIVLSAASPLVWWLGYPNLAADDVIAMCIHGVDVDFVRKVQKHGFKDLSVDKLIKLKQYGILD